MALNPLENWMLSQSRETTVWNWAFYGQNKWGYKNSHLLFNPSLYTLGVNARWRTNWELVWITKKFVPTGGKGIHSRTPPAETWGKHIKTVSCQCVSTKDLEAFSSSRTIFFNCLPSIPATLISGVAARTLSIASSLLGFVSPNPYYVRAFALFQCHST